MFAQSARDSDLPSVPMASASSVELSNQDLIVAALSMCGGRLMPAHVEDIAIAAHKLDPVRFVWSRYRDQIDLEKIRASIRFLGREDGGGLVSGGTKEGWMLTRAGVLHVRALRSWLPTVVPADEETQVADEIDRVASTRAAALASADKVGDCTLTDIVELFRAPGISPHVPKHVLKERMFNIVDEKHSLRPIVDQLAKRF